MSENDYGDLIERWKVEMIEARAKWLGFSEDEIPDLQQMIVPELLKFKYDRSRGASERTAVKRTIHRLLFRELQDRRRHVRRANYETASLKNVGEQACPKMPEADRCALRMDLETAMASLTDLEREICEAVMRGEKPADLAKARDRTPGAIGHALARIRRKFRAFGLDEYMG